MSYGDYRREHLVKDIYKMRKHLDEKFTDICIQLMEYNRRNNSKLCSPQSVSFSERWVGVFAEKLSKRAALTFKWAETLIIDPPLFSYKWDEVDREALLSQIQDGCSLLIEYCKAIEEDPGNIELALDQLINIRLAIEGINSRLYSFSELIMNTDKELT